MKYNYTDVTGVPHTEQWADKVTELQQEIEALGFVKIGHLETVCVATSARHVTEIYRSADGSAFLEPEHESESQDFVGRVNAAAWTVFDDGFIVATSLFSPYTLAHRILYPWLRWAVRGMPGGLSLEFLEERSLERLWAAHLVRVEEHRVATRCAVPPHDRVALLQVAQERAGDVGTTWGRLNFAVGLIAFVGLGTPCVHYLLPIIEVSWWRSLLAFIVLPVGALFFLTPCVASLCKHLPWPRQVSLSELMKRSGLQGEFDAANPRTT